MISILSRYIIKVIVVATGLATLIIIGVLFLITLLNELKNIGEGDYSISHAFIYVLLRLPNELYKFSPMLILLGSIIGLSILSLHKELAVMRSSGFSINKIILSVMGGALLLTVGISFIGEWIAPNLSYRAEINKENAKNAGQSVVTASGVWMHVDNNFIHVRHVIGRHLFEGVTRYQFDASHHLEAAFYAKRLTLQNAEWQMFDVLKTSFYNERTQSDSYPQLAWNLKFNPSLLNVGLLEPSEMSLPKLAKFSHYLKKNGLQSTEYRYEFWHRIFQPIASLVMIFLAIPFVLGTFSTSTMGRRIVIGVLTGFAFFISNAFLGQLCIVYQIPTIFAAALPLIIFIVVGFFLSKRIIRN